MKLQNKIQRGSAGKNFPAGTMLNFMGCSMLQLISDSLTRQAKGSQLLTTMLQEEYALLRAGQPDQIATLELSIQELIRQLVREREFLLRVLESGGFARLRPYLNSLDPADQARLEGLLAQLSEHEQASARQSTVNADLAMALWAQSGELLQFFQNKVSPQVRQTYTAKGTWYHRPATAALVHGRL